MTIMCVSLQFGAQRARSRRRARAPRRPSRSRSAPSRGCRRRTAFASPARPSISSASALIISSVASSAAFSRLARRPEWCGRRSSAPRSASPADSAKAASCTATCASWSRGLGLRAVDLGRPAGTPPAPARGRAGAQSRPSAKRLKASRLSCQRCARRDVDRAPRPRRRGGWPRRGVRARVSIASIQSRRRGAGGAGAGAARRRVQPGEDRRQARRHLARVMPLCSSGA